MSAPLRLIFLGTPDFAVPTLESLLAWPGGQVVAVVTAPDRPAGRGRQLQASAVKEAALAHSLPVLQPTNLKAPDFQADLKSYAADLQVVVAFRMLPEAVWNMPRLGSVNIHASLLPQYRGAAPINWALMRYELFPASRD
jgi:methionyl-tRNA formyltransferase